MHFKLESARSKSMLHAIFPRGVRMSVFDLPPSACDSFYQEPPERSALGFTLRPNKAVSYFAKMTSCHLPQYKTIFVEILKTKISLVVFLGLLCN
jgi:hypothetical protein